MGKDKVQYGIDPELLTNFLYESEESLATLDSLFVELEQDSHNKDIIGSIFRVAHSIKGLAAFLNLKDIKNLTHELETVLANIRDDKLCINSAIIDCLLTGFDEVSNMVTRVRAGRSQVANENKLAQLIEKVKGLSDLDIRGENKNISEALEDVANGVGQISEQVEKLDKAGDQIIEEVVQQKSKGSTPTEIGRTMRVSEEKVDVFMQYVGDLIEVSESFNLLQKRIDGNSDIKLADEFKDINTSFNQLSDKLQKSLLAIRKVPAGNLVQKITCREFGSKDTTDGSRSGQFAW